MKWMKRLEHAVLIGGFFGRQRTVRPFCSTEDVLKG